MTYEIQKSTNMYGNNEKLRAAYALNMCTVSVSQIIDYHDSYILEQEYDAILNNLNLKQMPKDESLLQIISELLNTITFFKIQEIKKVQIEKRYQQRMKNAIWSAVPSLNVIVSGDPVAIALSIATQIGSSYLNYRREKANANLDKSDAEIELEITAIEQLNALRRELFTTAWRLADEYDFDDEWRLTEKQIKQYNSILIDTNEYRKYARLESISENFKAYPPFWYFYGHTANYIAEMAKMKMQNLDKETEEYNKQASVVKTYTDKAIQHYEYYYSLSDYNILREDQLTAQFALEYIDILWNEEEVNLTKIEKLLALAEKMGANSFDILQLCGISYLKIGKTNEAARLFKKLANEKYNESVNVKLLSRIYVSQFIFGSMDESEKASAEYQILVDTTESVNLFPMPKASGSDLRNEDGILQNNFIEQQKTFLQQNYQNVIAEFINSYTIKYNKLWSIPNTAGNINEQYFDCSKESQNLRNEDVKKVLNTEQRAGYISGLYNSSLRLNFLNLINDTLHALDDLALFRNYEDKEDLVLIIRKKIVNSRSDLNKLFEKMETGNFSFEDYEKLQEILSYQNFTKPFFNGLITSFNEQLDNLYNICYSTGQTPMGYLEAVEIDLVEFCRNNSLPDIEEIRENKASQIDIVNNEYFSDKIWGRNATDERNRKEKRKYMENTIQNRANSLIKDNQDETKLLLPETDEFNAYFVNVNFKSQGLKSKVLAILDDTTGKDKDLILTDDGYILVSRNRIMESGSYDIIKFARDKGKEELKLDRWTTYSNQNVNLYNLSQLTEELLNYGK